MADRRNESSAATADYPPKDVFGICAGCGAVAWELLDGRSSYCLGCDPTAYRDDEDDDPCAYCDCEGDDECWRFT